MATLDILGLDPNSPPIQLPKPTTTAPVRKPAATAQPLNTKSSSASSSSSTAKSPASSSSPPTPTPSATQPSHPVSGAGSLAYTSAGVAYTVPAASPASSSFSRHRWTESQLSLRASEFTATKELLVFVGSWNVNGKKTKDERDLSPWLLHRIKVKGEGKSASATQNEDDDTDNEDESAAAAKDRRFKSPDIYVIGFQEIVDLNAGNLLVDHSASEPWEDFILETFAATGKTYVKITTVHLVGLSLCVFVKDKHRDAVNEIRVDEVGCGIMGVGGNKGAVLIKMKIYKTVFCFINSHLAAHQGAVKARNADFWSIIRRANFEGPKKLRIRDAETGEWMDGEELRRKAQLASLGGQSNLGNDFNNIAASASNFFDSMVNKSKVIMDNVQKKGANANNFSQASSSEDNEENQHHSIEDFEMIRKNPHGIFQGTHHIIWLGDNNYRLNVVELGMSATHTLIDMEDYPRLLKYDQLLIEKRAKNAFIGFTEPPIEFKPTYKFITGTSEYDRREDKKIRFPAYTDRIQFMTCRPTNKATSLAALTHPGDIILNNLHALYYTSTWKLTASDHKPVMLLLEAQIIYEREKSKRKILADLEQLTDEECIPRLYLSTTQLAFGTVCFGYSMTRSLVIKNVGDAVVAYRLMTRNSAAQTGAPQGGMNSEAALSKPWLRILPTHGLLGRGQTQTIHITIHVTSRNGAAQLLTSDAEVLECDLVLRLDGGVLYKVHLDADYEKSICGCELSYLNALPGKNIRKAVPEDVINNDESYSIPQFLFKLIDYMTEKKGITKLKQNAFIPPEYEVEEEDDEEEESATTSSTSSSKAKKAAGKSAIPVSEPMPQQVCTHAMRWILDYLDTGRSLDKEPKTGKWKCPAAPAPVEAPAELPASAFLHTLLYWLASLPSPLLVASSSQRWVTGMDLTAWCYQTLLETEVEKYRTLVYIITFAREIVTHQRSNGCNVAALSSMLGIALSHKSATSALSPIMPITPANIIQHLLTSPDFAKLPQDNAEHHQALQAGLAPAQPASSSRPAPSAPRGRYNDIQ